MTPNLWRFRVVTYSELSREIEQLSYRDKFRLGQLLIQLARKEEEEQNPGRGRNVVTHQPASTQSWFNLSLIGSRN
jgi:hypothetical protein